MTSRSRYARCRPQYRGLRRSVISLPRSQCSTRNGPLPIGSARLRILDSVPPHCRQVFAQERVPRQDPPEQTAERTQARTQYDPDRLRVDRADAANNSALDGGVVGRSVLQERPVREHEVRGRDRYSVAPSGLGPDVIREHERPPPRVGDTRDEPRTPGEVGTDVERRLQNPAEDRPERERRRSRTAPLGEGIEAGGLVRRLGEHDGAAALRRRWAPAPPAPETARSKTAIAAANARATSPPRSTEGCSGAARNPAPLHSGRS